MRCDESMSRSANDSGLEIVVGKCVVAAVIQAATAAIGRDMLQCLEAVRNFSMSTKLGKLHPPRLRKSPAKIS